MPAFIWTDSDDYSLCLKFCKMLLYCLSAQGKELGQATGGMIAAFP